MQNSKENTDRTSSDQKGLKGLFEVLLRRYKTAMHILTVLPLYLISCGLIGLGLYPAVRLFQWTLEFTQSWPKEAHALALALSFPFGYLAYGVSMMVILPVFNSIGGLRLKAWRGSYYSVQAVPWYIHNALTYILRFTFLEFITPTPLLNLFYKCMGMKIGDGTVINTTYISDPSLISLGEKVTLGGSVTIVGHYGQGGYLVLAPVEIGDRATIGLKASVMGGAKIGADAKILPHSVVLPKTEIPAGETWGGVPAKRIQMDDLKQKKIAAN